MGAMRFFFLLTVAMCAFSFMIDVPAQSKRCFIEELDNDELLVGQYIVHPSYQQVIDISITDCNNQVLFQKKNAKEGNFAFTSACVGDHLICIDNMLAEGMVYASGLQTRVTLEVNTGIAARDYDALATQEHLKPTEVKVLKMLDEARQIFRDYEYFKDREATMRDTNESTNFRVMMLSIISMVFVLASGAWQFIYLRRFLDLKQRRR
eukprot:TRINITY_DN5177_c0_g1_i3.p2 TRINITY_DN5177_c0_g1~~TRINITY_DN5177_c0_g1_i3.p2  ORF type:complete len:208 (-),score=53.85 TRINITY_DN5177_c0_g1_i3:704-1327(-)